MQIMVQNKAVSNSAPDKCKCNNLRGNNFSDRVGSKPVHVSTHSSNISTKAYIFHVYFCSLNLP